jgi:hypothetical protein
LNDVHVHQKEHDFARNIAAHMVGDQLLTDVEQLDESMCLMFSSYTKSSSSTAIKYFLRVIWFFDCFIHLFIMQHTSSEISNSLLLLLLLLLFFLHIVLKTTLLCCKTKSLAKPWIFPCQCNLATTLCAQYWLR